MPKVSRIPKHRGGNVSAVKCAEESNVSANSDVTVGSPSRNELEQNEVLSRGQRKRQAKREQYLRREQMILASLRLKREEEQRKRIDGLDAIRDALLATVEPKEEKTDDQLKKDNMLKSSKSRQRLLQQEVAQMNLVLQHPSFTADPLGTLQEHLRNTLANEVQHQQKEAIKHAKEKVVKQAEKIALKKESGAKRKKKKFKATRSKTR